MKYNAIIKVQGIVQGVGFRPFIHKLSLENNLYGYALNSPEGVLIEVEGTKEDIENFYKDLIIKEPPASRIIYRTIEYQKTKGFNEFKIAKSNLNGVNSIFISPDLAICNDCREEFLDILDRRHCYPFINCTNCGPRYTIIEGIPYDRPLTTMKEFIMCPTCKKEYEFIEDRRYHAQPDCCPECGPHIFWKEEGKDEIIDRAISIACEAVKKGKIIAIKGLGGFHICCDATNDKAVNLLRARKQRPAKPFAVMFPSINILKEYVTVTEEGKILLNNSISPIVMLEKKQNNELSDSLSPGLNNLGVMIPYTPLHELIFRLGNFKALVMTSGNFQSEPIHIENKECFEYMKPLVDGFLFHNRKIARRCDDSVVKIKGDNIQILRRASHEKIRKRPCCSYKNPVYAPSQFTGIYRHLKFSVFQKFS